MPGDWTYYKGVHVGRWSFHVLFDSGRVAYCRPFQDEHEDRWIPPYAARNAQRP